MTKLETIIKKQLKIFQDEYNPLSKKFFGKGSTFADKDLQKGAFLEQRIDDLNHILEALKQKRKLVNWQFDMLKKAGIELSGREASINNKPNCKEV
jgi:hypothetical protein